jgi:hypothetical protein
MLGADFSPERQLVWVVRGRQLRRAPASPGILVDKADIPKEGLGEPPQPHVTFLW